MKMDRSRQPRFRRRVHTIQRQRLQGQPLRPHLNQRGYRQRPRSPQSDIGILLIRGAYGNAPPLVRFIQGRPYSGHRFDEIRILGAGSRPENDFNGVPSAQVGRGFRNRAGSSALRIP